MGKKSFSCRFNTNGNFSLNFFIPFTLGATNYIVIGSFVNYFPSLLTLYILIDSFVDHTKEVGCNKNPQRNYGLG